MNIKTKNKFLFGILANISSPPRPPPHLTSSSSSSTAARPPPAVPLPSPPSPPISPLVLFLSSVTVRIEKLMDWMGSLRKTAGAWRDYSSSFWKNATREQMWRGRRPCWKTGWPCSLICCRKLNLWKERKVVPMHSPLMIVFYISTIYAQY